MLFTKVNLKGELFTVHSYRHSVAVVSKSAYQFLSRKDNLWHTRGSLTVLLYRVFNFNYFDVVMKKIQAEIVYPINNTPLGGGVANDIAFKNGEQTNFTFPFTLTYSPSVDSSGQVLADLAKKCGALGGQRQDLSVNYKITVSTQSDSVLPELMKTCK